ncbi:DUF4249 domain-containing protein [Dyadobacter sp. Leaf189]|uniref:DUF4249 domain-containing protein n=1 Tax=Dyadobacter sp. Leaf189 TaxID=1736295 RepID=UPI0006F4F260|nr:DUF4249 domain-containing protein [Dyadobacter sp. Leaf189]KQS27903.1 hypothetical protein ASG33_15945 [Dyadobacter sp. Leaf189]
MKQLIIILLSFLILVGCKERGVNLQLPYEGDKLVLFGQVNTTDTVRIEVQKTYPPTDKSTYIEGIANATVGLFDEHGFLETLKYHSKGIYMSGSGRKWLSGSRYRIEVEAPGLPPASTALEMMPTAPVVINYEFGRSIDSKFNPGTPSKELIISIQDHLNEENYYMVIVKRSIGKDTFGTSIFDLDRPMDDFEDPCQFRYRSNIVLSDLCAENGKIILRKGVELNDQFGKEVDWTALDKVTVSTRQISKSYYEFCKTYYTESELITAFMPPFPRYTNITGGYGIFTGYNEITKEFILKK